MVSKNLRSRKIAKIVAVAVTVLILVETFGRFLWFHSSLMFVVTMLIPGFSKEKDREADKKTPQQMNKERQPSCLSNR
uniref:Uncharacterized protein n=1 Tax=Lutzomyia longipalpis TaxID=7200 RepID=A0A1B0GIZ4_LUTLO